MVGIPSCAPPTKLVVDTWTQDNIIQQAADLGPKGQIYLSRKSFLFSRPSAEPLPWDGRITKWLFINSGRAKLWNEGLGTAAQAKDVRNIRAHQDDWPQTLQALNPSKL